MTTPHRRHGVAVLVAVCLAALLAACGGDDGPDDGTARLTVTGAATVTQPDGVVVDLRDADDVTFGSVVRMVSGTATMELPAGATYELRAGEADPTEVEVDGTPTLLAGDLLITAGFPASVRIDVAMVTARGAVQVRTEGPDARAYTGDAAIVGIDPLVAVDALHRVLLTPAASAEPIEFDPSDPWDRRYLGAAAALGERLESLSRGYTNELPSSATRSIEFFERVIPQLGDEREFGVGLIDPARPVGETLVGASIVVGGNASTFRQRWDEVFAFRDAGAGWGIVALSQGVSTTVLLDTIELAIGTSPAAGAPSDATTTTSGPTPSTSPTVPSTGPTTTAPTTTLPPVTVPPPPPEPPPGLLTPLLDPVATILSELLGILGLG